MNIFIIIALAVPSLLLLASAVVGTYDFVSDRVRNR